MFSLLKACGRVVGTVGTTSGKAMWFSAASHAAAVRMWAKCLVVPSVVQILYSAFSYTKSLFHPCYFVFIPVVHSPNNNNNYVYKYIKE